MASYKNLGSKEKPNYQVDAERSTSANPHGTAKKAIAAKAASKEASVNTASKLLTQEKGAK